MVAEAAKGLHYAHEKRDEGGAPLEIVHRDVSPQNVLLAFEGIVKIADFGIASARLTDEEEGVLKGKYGYMSPEQARGKPVDKRADIWAFGVVLFELLTGRQLFAGETVSDVLAAVLTREPDWSALPAATPAAVLRLLHRCLARDPKLRLHDIADARLE
ncbi:serine/threonine-protein kinase, partial [Staphylococcus aureus]|nr:serine/threonine-protein kinase [Staphylococcus aureus]